MSHDPLACAARPGLSAGPPPSCRTQSLAVLCLLYLRLRVTDSTPTYIYLLQASAGRRDGHAGGVAHGSRVMGYTSCSNTRRPRGDSGTGSLRPPHHTPTRGVSHANASGSATGGRKTSNRMLQACAVRCPARVSRPRPSRPRACHRGCRRSK